MSGTGRSILFFCQWPLVPGGTTMRQTRIFLIDLAKAPHGALIDSLRLIEAGGHEQARAVPVIQAEEYQEPPPTEPLPHRDEPADVGALHEVK